MFRPPFRGSSRPAIERPPDRLYGKRWNGVKSAGGLLHRVEGDLSGARAVPSTVEDRRGQAMDPGRQRNLRRRQREERLTLTGPGPGREVVGDAAARRQGEAQGARGEPEAGPVAIAHDGAAGSALELDRGPRKGLLGGALRRSEGHDHDLRRSFDVVIVDRIETENQRSLA